MHDARRLSVDCDEPVSAQVDGEYLGELVAADLEGAPDALSVLVPPPRPARPRRLVIRRVR
jgi:diacylglycerol kinase family enzyme